MSPNEISAIPLFRAVRRSRRAELAKLADRLTAPAGRILTKQGAIAHEFFVIVDGTVDVLRDGRLVTTLGPGEFFGEIALMDDPHRTATIVAASDVDLVVIGRREFHTMVSGFPELASTLLAAATRRVIADLRAVEAA